MPRPFWCALALAVGGLIGAVGAYAVPSGQNPPIGVDLSNYPTTSAVSAAISAAMPAPCATVPAADTLLGTVGSGNCFQRPTDTRPTVVQAATVTTDSNGNWSVTWAKAFNGASPYINPQAINSAGTQPYICNVASSTSGAASGKCWQTLTMTLPNLATSLLGLVLNPTGAASTIQVRVAARDTTQ